MAKREPLTPWGRCGWRNLKEREKKRRERRRRRKRRLEGEG